jgi:hypothetical protein
VSEETTNPSGLSENWGIWLGAWVVWAVAALNGRKLEMPILGKLADVWRILNT